MNNGRPLLVIEQRNLFGGLDLAVPHPHRKAPRRKINVDGRFKVGFATALAIVIEHGKRAHEAKLVPEHARCPRCGKVGKTGEDFGTRVLQGRRVPQSWCRGCRSHHLKPMVKEQASWLDS